MTTPIAPSPFAMPGVEIGQVVWWRQNSGDRPTAGIVTEVGQRKINLSVAKEGQERFEPRDGVPHKSDPDRQRILDNAGFWEHIPGFWEHIPGMDHAG